MTPKILRISVEAYLHHLGNCKTVDDLVAWAEAIKDQVPEEYRSSSAVQYDDGEYASLQVYYERPETEAERQKRERDERVEEERRKAETYNWERLIYAVLKAKFEPNG